LIGASLIFEEYEIYESSYSMLLKCEAKTMMELFN